MTAPHQFGDRLRVERIGAERAPVMVIDDFLPDAVAWRHVAARQNYKPIQGHLYPGVRAPAPDAYIEHVTALQEIVRETFDLDHCDLRGWESDFSIVTTPRGQLTLLQCIPHFDTNRLTQIAVLHYLCDLKGGGTAFYRHRDTGFEVISAERRDAYFASVQEGIKAGRGPRQTYITGDTDLFEQIYATDAVFNRAIIYRSASLHSGNLPADFELKPDPVEGRLTANTFLHFWPVGEQLPWGG